MIKYIWTVTIGGKSRDIEMNEAQYMAYRAARTLDDYFRIKDSHDNIIFDDKASRIHDIHSKRVDVHQSNVGSKWSFDTPEDQVRQRQRDGWLIKVLYEHECEFDESGMIKDFQGDWWMKRLNKAKEDFKRDYPWGYEIIEKTCHAWKMWQCKAILDLRRELGCPY